MYAPDAFPFAGACIFARVGVGGPGGRHVVNWLRGGRSNRALHGDGYWAGSGMCEPIVRYRCVQRRGSAPVT